MVCGELKQDMLGALLQLPMGTCCEKVELSEGQDTYVFFDANEEFYKCIGYSEEEFAEKGNSLLQVAMRDSRRKMAEKRMSAVTYPGKTYSETLEVMQAEGKITVIQWNVRCFVDETGEKYLFSCCSRFEELLHRQSELIDKLHKERQERKRLDDLIYELPVGVAIIKSGDRVLVEVANTEFLESKGYERKELLENTDLTKYIYRADREKFLELLENCRSNKKIEKLELRIIAKNGELRWEYLQCQLYYYRNAIPYYILTTWDINERKKLEDDLRLMDEQYQMLEEVAEEFPFEYDVAAERFRVPQKYYENGKVTDRNKKYASVAEMLGDIYKEDHEVFMKALQKAATREITGNIDYRLNIAPEGKRPVYVWYRTFYRSMRGGDEKISRIIGRSYDISYDRGIQEKLSEEMRRDPLTRLLNKVAVGEAIRNFLAEHPQGTHVLFLVDIDNFKRINDSFGHTVGDTVITDIAQSIGKLFQKTDIVGRIGGDEFLAFMTNTTVEDAAARAERLCKEVSKKLIGDEAEVSVTLSVGMSVYKTDGEDFETLFDMADRAMYQTKRAGKNCYSFARKGVLVNADEKRRKRMFDDTSVRGQEADKEFLNFAFSILSHARDVNGSLNVLIEQIGKRYGLDVVSVFEYADDAPEMTLTNSWSNYKMDGTQEVLPRTISEFKQAESGEFVEITSESMKQQNRAFWEKWKCEENQVSHIAGAKFEIPGNHTGCLYVGVVQKEEGFSRKEQVTLCELSRIVAVFVSLRNRMRDDQREIRQLQNRDKLTGLYNLDAFRQKTEKMMEKEPADGNVYALVHSDINNFSYVNENFGQRVGDGMLKEFAVMLEKGEHVKEACRMYSDYFLQIVCGESEEDIYRKVFYTNREFEMTQKQKYPAGSVHMSAGICFIRDRGEGFDMILEGANLARKQAKEQRSSVVIYREDMRERRDDEIQITGRFYAALQRGEIELFLQPKFLLGEQKIYGAEALARWRLESGEILSPAKFIPPLERVGYIIDLDFYILEQLLRLMKRWKEAGRELFTISTNFSRKNFENGGTEFIERLQKTMERYRIEPKYIEIEITESVIVENLSDLKACLAKLEKIGFRIAIDDFGTGYSSLSVLLEIPADVVKIDKSFIDRIDLKEQQDFVLQMGQFIKSAKEEVIFEGIEEPEQCQLLKNCGFEYGQGFLFDRPLPATEFERKYV